jgi:MFS family permease
MAPYPPPAPAYFTKDGVKYFSYVLLLEVVVGLVGFLLALGAIAMILSLGSGNWGNAWGAIVAIAGVAVVLLIFALLAFIFFIVGWIKFYQGKDEFGPAHAKNFMMAVVFFILGLVIPWIGSAFSPGYAYNTNINDYYNSIRTSLIISGVLGIIGPLFNALMFTTLVKQFTNEEASKFKIATIMVIVGPVIGLVAALALLPGKPGSGVTVSQLVSFYSVASMALSVGSIVSLIGYFFFYQGYKSILGKMESGHIRPGLMLQPVPMGAPGYAPPPVPLQPYQAPVPYSQQPAPPQYPPQQYAPQQYPYPPYPPQQPPQYPPPQY